MGGEKGIQSPLHTLDRVQRPDVCNLTIITLRNLLMILLSNKVITYLNNSLSIL